MKSLNNYVEESLLSDIDTNLSLGDDEIVKMHILNELHDPNKYYYDRLRNDDDKYFKIFKHRNKWVVDVNGFITCYCPDGYVTDGSFEFGTIRQGFLIWGNEDDPCYCKSLQYGPKIVCGTYTLDGCKDLKDLKYCPTQVLDELRICNTGITTLKYFPKSCYAVQIVDNKNLKTLKGAKYCNIKRKLTITHNGIYTTKDMLMNMDWKVTDITSVNASREYVSDESKTGGMYSI